MLFQVAGFQLQTGSGLGYIDAAKEKGAYAIGVDADQWFIAPETILTSAVKRIDRAVLATIRAVVEGRFRPGENAFGAEGDGIGYGTLHRDVPQSVIGAAETALADLRSGRVRPPDTVRK